MCAVNQSNRCEYVSSLIVQVPVSPYKSSQPRQMSLENHFSKQQQWESLCTFKELKVMDVSGPGILTFWRRRFFQTPTQWGAAQAATPSSQGGSDFGTSCRGFFHVPRCHSPFWVSCHNSSLVSTAAKRERKGWAGREREAEKAKKMDEDRGSKGERQMEEDTSRKWCAFCSVGGVLGPLLSGSFTGFAEVTGSSSLMESQRKGASRNY